MQWLAADDDAHRVTADRAAGSLAADHDVAPAADHDASLYAGFDLELPFDLLLVHFRLQCVVYRCATITHGVDFSIRVDSLTARVAEMRLSPIRVTRSDGGAAPATFGIFFVRRVLHRLRRVRQ